MDNLSDLIFWLIFGGILLYWVFNMVRRGGFKGSVFDAKILETVGEADGVERPLMKTKLKVHVLDRDSEKLVGIELVATSIGSYQMMPINLSATETRKLIHALEQAVSKL